MPISQDYPEKDVPIEAWCDLHQLHVRLQDGREISNPLWWYPVLLNATPAQRNNVEYMLAGIHWPEIDEDISIEGMMKGWKAPGAKEPENEAA
jgi:hypothetical protein